MNTQGGTLTLNGGGISDSTAPADSARISKELLQEVRRDDAAMADDLVALAPRSGRAFRAVAGAATSNAEGPLDARVATSNAAAIATSSSSPAVAAAAAAAGGGGGGGGFSMSVNDTLTANDFVKQKREVGLVRMSLATKKAEIRKLDEKVDRAERRLRQQQEQLTNTQEKFNNFLKFSNLEQDAAVRKADDETRAKHAKTIEIKKLSALISHAELETRKIRLQVENCVAYKDFLEGLVKPQWFYDVLICVRAEDTREEILLNAEATYQKRCEDLKKTYEAQVAARLAAQESEELEKRRTSPMRERSIVGAVASSTQLPRGQSGGGKRNSSSGVAPDDAKKAEAEQEVPLEKQLNDLHDSMEDDARAAIAAAEAAIRAEVTAMPLSAVKAALHRDYDENRLPMCFGSVDELLEVFINVEEGNLFLIQNCQELEEELEGISIGFVEEKTEMKAMVAQRTAQLTVLQENIAGAQKKLKALDDHIASLEPRNSRTAGTSTASSGGGDATGRAAVASASTTAPNPQADLSPEELKARIESSIGHMFQLLTAGDQAIKAVAAKREAVTAEAVNATSGSGSSRAGSSNGSPDSRTGHSDGDGPAGAPLKGAAHQSKLQPGNAGSAVASPGATASGKKPRKSAVSQSQRKQQQQQQQQQRDASMGPVEMLTIVENKLEEYHRYLTDPANHIDVSLIQAVMKQSDKQRRHQARMVHLASQEQAQEERIKRALERSQAPIVHRTGKPVRPRSHISKAVDKKTQRKAERAAAAMEGSGTSIDSDEDGAEFFR